MERFEAQMDPGPNEHNGTIVVTPVPVCQIDVDHYRGPMQVSGTVRFDPTNRQLQMTVSGNNNQITPHVTWAFVYDGRPE